MSAQVWIEGLDGGLTSGHLADLAFMFGLRTAPTTKLYPVPFQAAEWRWLAIDREVKRRAKPWTRLLLKLAPNMRANVQPARFAIAPPVKVLGAERVPCVGCGVAIRATGKGPVTRRGAMALLEVLQVITEKTVTQYECSDGVKFTDRLDAEIHEAEYEIRALCDKYGYSGMSSRSMGDVLIEAVDFFAAPLGRLASARSAKRATFATGGKGSQAAAHNAGPIVVPK